MIRSADSITQKRLPRYATREILDAVGGGYDFDAEVYFASAWRNEIPGSYVTLKAGGGGVVAKICFDDGVCWADKTVQHDNQLVYSGMVAMSVAQKHSSNIPVPKIMGWCQRKLDYYL